MLDEMYEGSFFINNFTDFNYIAPLALYAQSVGKKLNLSFFFEDLNKPHKIIFQQYAQEMLDFDFVKSHHVTVLKERSEIKKALKSHGQLVVSTTPTLHHLLKKRLIQNSFFENRSLLVGLDYFGEFTPKIISKLNLIFLSSSIWNKGYPHKKVKYGLPYWDLFASDKLMLLAPNPDIYYDTSKQNIVISEITNEKDSWHDMCFDYVSKNYHEDSHYYIRFRLKVEDRIEKNESLKKKLSRYKNITYIDSPYFFTTVSLLQNSAVVFLSNVSMMIADCMAADSAIIRAYNKPRLDVWEERESNMACDNYYTDPEKTKQSFIAQMGSNSEMFFDSCNALISN